MAKRTIEIPGYATIPHLKLKDGFVTEVGHANLTSEELLRAMNNQEKTELAKVAYPRIRTQQPGRLSAERTAILPTPQSAWVTQGRMKAQRRGRFG